MKISVSLVFLLLFAAVTALYLYLMPTQELDIVSEPPKVMKLLPLEENDLVTTIEIQNEARGETITLSRDEENGWIMIYPVVYEADRLMVEGLVRALTLSSKARRLQPEHGWAEYGLDEPHIKVGVETQRGERRRYLYFGEPSAVGDFVFGRWDRELEYFLLAADLKKAFDRSAYSLRDKRLVRTGLKDLTKIRIQTLSEYFEIVKRRDGWVWMEPVMILGDDVSAKSMNELLTMIKNIYIKEFLDDQKSDRDVLGISADGNRLEFWAGDASLPEAVLIGQGMPEKDAYYCVREGEDLLFLVASGNLHSLVANLQTMARDAGAVVAE